MKFLIDECLSPELAKLALKKGYDETSHVVWMKLAGLKDWELKPIILGNYYIGIHSTENRITKGWVFGRKITH